MSDEDEISRLEANLSTPIQIAGAPFRPLSLAARMAHYHVPGVSICRFRDGEITWARGWGRRHAETVSPIGADTRFQAASVSKPIAAATVMALVDRGAIDLDADVQTYLGGWSLPRAAGLSQRAVTLRMLLSHTAGASVSGFHGYASGAPLPTLVDILEGRPPANSDPIRIASEPGGEAAYSGGGYVIVQRIVENVTGRTFAEVARDHVLAPAGMTNSLFAQPLSQAMMANSAVGHNGDGQPIPGGGMVYPELAPAGLWSTPTDLAKFAISFQRSLHGRRGLLRQASAITMATRQNGVWAIGFELIGENPDWAVYHTGSNTGFKCFLLAEKNALNGAAVMTNAENGSSLFQEILAGMAVMYGWPHLGPREIATVDLSQPQLERFAGVYHMREPIEADFQVTAQQGHLVIAVPGFLPATEFFPRSETSFFDLTGSRAAFEQGASGAFDTLVWDGAIRAARV